MTDRIIEFGREGGYLKLQHKQLLLLRDGETIASIPIEDLAAVILDHPEMVISKKAMECLAEHNVLLVNTDAQHMPVATMLPLDANGLQTERLRQQVAMGKAAQKQLWKQTIQAKLRAQARVLKDLTGIDAGILPLSKKVKSGDPDNLEAQGARRYWSRLFTNFKRDRFGEDQNRFLNYGYAILRALVCRALCASGLHPGLGIHHHNRYNAFPLADDLMEPYRPFVDMHVYELVQQYGADAELDQSMRQRLLQLVELRLSFQQEQQTLPNAVLKSAQSLLKVVQGERKDLVFPDV